jgi:hypothetical protein
MPGLGRLIQIHLSVAVLIAVTAMSPAVQAQESGDASPPSGVVEPSEEGRRLGNVPNDQIRQFNLRRACEEDLPECLPWVRAQMEEERRNRMWMGAGIGGMLLLIFLLAKRESDRKRARQAREAREHRKLGARVAKKWRNEVKDPYGDADPLGDK